VHRLLRKSPGGRFQSANDLLAALKASPTPKAQPEAGPPPGDDARWGPWDDLFDGKTLSGWKVVESFGTPGKAGTVAVQDGSIVLSGGPHAAAAGFFSTLSWPTVGYEVVFDIMRIKRSRDPNCACAADVVFPVESDWSDLVIGGGLDENAVALYGIESRHFGGPRWTKFMTFNDGQWYQVRLCVTESAIRAWIDTEKVVDERRGGLGIQPLLYRPRQLKPFGLLTHSDRVALRNICLRRLKAEAGQK